MLGDDHPETIRVRSNLAAVLFQQGDLAGAEDAYREILTVRRRLLGPDHPDIARTLDFQVSIEDAGLPPAEQSFWESTNLTREEVNAVAQFLAQVDLELRDPSVSMSRILHEEAAELAGK